MDRWAQPMRNLSLEVPTLRLYCLHGSLQTPAVWDTFRAGLLWESYAPDVFAFATETETGAYSWAQAFHEKCDPCGDRRDLLLGYSLGGRLALHTLLFEPRRWAGAILIAAHPGLADPRARARRRTSDRAWANRFANEPWSKVLAAWDRQAVFQGIPCPLLRPQAPESRMRAVAGFLRFSLGFQADLRLPLQERSTILPPILYVTGARDDKYTDLGAILAAICPTIETAVVPAAGHRVPWENPAGFRNAIQAFLTRIASAH